MPGLALGDVIPNIEADSTQGPIKLHDYIDESWTIIFSHPGKLSFDYEISVSLFDLTVSSTNSFNLVHYDELWGTVLNSRIVAPVSLEMMINFTLLSAL